MRRGSPKPFLRRLFRGMISDYADTDFTYIRANIGKDIDALIDKFVREQWLSPYDCFQSWLSARNGIKSDSVQSD